MYKQFLKFCGKEIEKNKFYCSKKPITINNIEINIMLIPDRFGFVKREMKIRSLCMKIPKINRRSNSFKETKYVLLGSKNMNF